MSSEHTEQVALFTWANSGYMLGRYPELAFMFAIPNGGQRHAAVAAKMKREGVKAGVLDICLPAPRGNYHGLYLEMKYGDNWLSKDQERWAAFLYKQGYAVAVAKSSEQAQQVIENYLEGRKV